MRDEGGGWGLRACGKWCGRICCEVVVFFSVSCCGARFGQASYISTMSDLHRRLSRRPSDVDQEKEGRGLLGFRSRKLDFCDSGKGKEGAMGPPTSGSRKRESLNEETHIEDVPRTPVKKSATSKLPAKYVPCPLTSWLFTL